MEENKKQFWTETAKVILLLTAGCAIYALGMDLFLVRENLLAGGVAGFSQILSDAFGLPISVYVILINIPLFIIGLLFINKRFMVYSLIGMAIYAGMIQLFSRLTISYESTLTSVVLGGVLTGFGLGLIYRSGASVGGTDIINKILYKYFAMNMATSGLLINCVIVFAAAARYGLDKAVLTICSMFIASQVTSFVIDGIDHRRVILIVTDKKDEVAGALMKNLSRGVTELPAQGAYTHATHSLLYCVVSKHQLPVLKATIKQADPNAFFTIILATGVYGKGSEFFSFQHIEG